MSNVIIDLFSKWNTCVNYCHWKSIDHLDASYQGLTDLDILVSKNDWRKAEAIASSIGFIEFDTTGNRRYPGVVDYICYCPNLDKLIHLHLHYQLMLGDRWVKSYHLPIEEHILKRKIWDGKFSTWIITPADELLIFVARMPLKFKDPFEKLKVSKELQFLIGNYNDEIPDDLSKSYTPQTISLAKDLIAQKKDINFKKYSKQIRAEMSSYKRHSTPLFTLVSLYRHIYRIGVELLRRKLKIKKFGRRRIRTGGLKVVFAGMDGSGKSSAITRNLAFFASQMDVSTYFMGAGKSGAPWYRKIVFNLFGSTAKLSSHKSMRNNSVSTTKKNPPFYYIVWWMLVAYERLKRLIYIHRDSSSGILVLIDRWPQNSIQQGFDSPRLLHNSGNGRLLDLGKKFESSVLEKSIHLPPDLIICMEIPPELSLERKPNELTFLQAKEAAENLKLIEWPEQATVMYVDSKKSIAEVDQQIKICIWKKLTGAI